MNFLVNNWYLILLALVSGGLLLWPQLQLRSGLSCSEAVNLMNRQKASLIDVRETAEYSQSHATAALHLPLSQVAEKIHSLVKNKNQVVILMCQSGSRSARAVALLKKQGYAQVHSLRGGLAAWQEAHLPVSGQA